MRLQTRSEKFNQIPTSAGERHVWANCDIHGGVITSKPIKTFNHGRECTVCKDCINKLVKVDDVPTLGNPTSKKLVYHVSIVTTYDIAKAYLLVNGYKHTSPNVWELKFNRFSAPRKIIDELTKTSKYGKTTVNVEIYRDSKLIEAFKNVKDASVIKAYTDTIK